ncbi:uncharacterized protein [Elaeis guineensis]|uniref:uncharacterized protein isoform X2 n=1 Tax=Elaeis guineensis var. tenera TaxID=51953 RepID=UPI003C6CE11E
MASATSVTLSTYPVSPLTPCSTMLATSLSLSMLSAKTSYIVQQLTVRGCHEWLACRVCSQQMMQVHLFGYHPQCTLFRKMTVDSMLLLCWVWLNILGPLTASS